MSNPTPEYRIPAPTLQELINYLDSRPARETRLLLNKIAVLVDEQRPASKEDTPSA